MTANVSDSRVLLLAPTARDGEASRALLASAGVQCVLVHSIEELCMQAEIGAAAVIVPEEAVAGEIPACFTRMIQQQPVWSDLPIIVLSRAGAESPAVELALSTLGNVSLVERPVRVSTLISLVRSALRARERQYQVREHLAQRKLAERELHEARETAEAANRAKDQFLAVLSHELRTPLSPVVMSIAAMENDPALPEEMRPDVAMIRRNIELESRLIDDLLDLSRVSTGKLRLRTESVAIHEVLKYVFEVCATDILSKKLNLVTHLDARLDCVTGDSARLQQVFWNLLKNAIKFSPIGETITVKTRNSQSGLVEVQISDNGVGIPADVLPKLFNAFEQGNPSITHQFGGLGLGLAISKAVIDLHSGSINAQSRGEGCGSTFTVQLANAEIPCEDAKPIAHSTSTNGKRMLRVLFVEDHVDTARVMSQLLNGLGYNVRTANTVAAALKCADAEPFDLLISDIGLPDATGYELMEQIRDRYKIKGIALSGYGMESDIQRGKAAGFSDHVTKPISVQQLQAVIQRVVSLD
jgi:signal transduction histidine kinase/CheY-like chemotaxis protein